LSTTTNGTCSPSWLSTMCSANALMRVCNRFTFSHHAVMAHRIISYAERRKAPYMFKISFCFLCSPLLVLFILALHSLHCHTLISAPCQVSLDREFVHSLTHAPKLWR
jgi:hypothetical protein